LYTERMLRHEVYKNKKSNTDLATGGGRKFNGGMAMLGDGMRMEVRPTWEDTQYRCQICTQILSCDMSSEMCPQIVCENIHTVCRKCTQSLKQEQAPKCPQCRQPLKKDDVPNRDVIFMLSIARMRCGGCESGVDMPCETDQKHARECSENHITCPLLNSDLMLSQCTHSMSVSALWEHCQQFHINASTHAVAMVNAKACENNWMSATMSVSMNFERNYYAYFTITTPTNQYNMCVHVTREVCDVIRADPKILLCVRRCFPETELMFHRKIISLEIGSICGMILPIPAVVSSCKKTCRV